MCKPHYTAVLNLITLKTHSVDENHNIPYKKHISTSQSYIENIVHNVVYTSVLLLQLNLRYSHSIRENSQLAYKTTSHHHHITQYSVRTVRTWILCYSSTPISQTVTTYCRVYPSLTTAVWLKDIIYRDMSRICV